MCIVDLTANLTEAVVRSYSVKNVFLRIFAKFTGKQLWWSHFLIKLQDRRPAILLKSDFGTDIFTSEFCELFKNDYFV